MGLRLEHRHTSVTWTCADRHGATGAAQAHRATGRRDASWPYHGSGLIRTSEPGTRDRTREPFSGPTTQGVILESFQSRKGVHCFKNKKNIEPTFLYCSHFCSPHLSIDCSHYSSPHSRVDISGTQGKGRAHAGRPGGPIVAHHGRGEPRERNERHRGARHTVGEAAVSCGALNLSFTLDLSTAPSQFPRKLSPHGDQRGPADLLRGPADDLCGLHLHTEHPRRHTLRGAQPTSVAAGKRCEP